MVMITAIHMVTQGDLASVKVVDAFEKIEKQGMR